MTYKSVKESVKSIKKVLQELKSVRKSTPAENLHHADKTWLQQNMGSKPEETSEQTRVP